MQETRKRAFLIGDLHQDFKPVRELYKRNLEELKLTENTLICLGDFGALFFFNYRDRNFKQQLKKYPFTYFIIRGNHEQRPSICIKQEPDKWHIEEYWGNQVYVENDYPYIKYALDTVAIYNAETASNVYKTLVIPGAYSVDKYKRLECGWSWFPSEQLSKEEMERGKKLIERNSAVDLVLSHTCPIIYEPTDLFLSVVDQSLVDKSMEKYMGEIEKDLDYRGWCWGHFHQFRDYPRLDGRFRTMLFNDFALDLDEYMNGQINKL